MTEISTGIITFDHISESANLGTTLFDFAESHGLTVPTSCYKQGKCRECLVEIESGAELLSEPAPQENHLIGNFRLACRTQLLRSGEVRCHTLRRGSLRIETEVVGLSDSMPALDPCVRREGSRIVIDHEIVADSHGPIHGLAIDIGTTTVALRLYDLENGRLMATQSFENPQRFGGSDIMARIRFDGEHPGRLLQRTLQGYLSRAITSLPVDPLTIYELVIAGNPTMRDLFFGLDVQNIGVIPYRSLTEAAYREGRSQTTSITKIARRLPVHPNARMYGLPVIGSHVGADAAACLLATGIGEGEQISALLDIGTNTEAFLGNRHRLLAASCPAGPAFEGGGVTCGMPALDGAIERIRILNDGQVAFETINNIPPEGICGSGLVDLLSELRRTEGMNEQGRLSDDATNFVVENSRPTVVTEADINELAQAKGANAAGLRVLVDAYGISMNQIDCLYLAGGFSRHIDVDAACRIGLIPDLPRERIKKVGNASLHGASIALLSQKRRADLEKMVHRIEHVRLETHPHFFDFFVDGCQFHPFGGAA